MKKFLLMIAAVLILASCESDLAHRVVDDERVDADLIFVDDATEGIPIDNFVPNDEDSPDPDVIGDEVITDEIATDDVAIDDPAQDDVMPDNVEPFCGDNIVNGTDVCDGDSVDCASIDPGKYASGVAWCNNGCTGYDESTCVLLEDYWVDPDTGLWWTRGQIDETGADVGTFKPLSCATFIMGGYDDWRVPTINELRTLISGCTRTEPYGACAVEDTCTESDCYSAVCDGCESGAGPWNGYYLKNAPWLMNPKVLEEKKFYIVWTSAMVGSANYNWGINFLDGRVMNKYTYFDYGGHSKCVRGGN